MNFFISTSIVSDNGVGIFYQYQGSSVSPAMNGVIDRVAVSNNGGKGICLFSNNTAEPTYITISNTTVSNNGNNGLCIDVLVASRSSTSKQLRSRRATGDAVSVNEIAQGGHCRRSSLRHRDRLTLSHSINRPFDVLVGAGEESADDTIRPGRPDLHAARQRTAADRRAAPGRAVPLVGRAGVGLWHRRHRHHGGHLHDGLHRLAAVALVVARRSGLDAAVPLQWSATPSSETRQLDTDLPTAQCWA